MTDIIPLQTVFVPLTTRWEGFGINIKVRNVATMTNEIQGLNAEWTRIYLELRDPGVDAVYFSNQEFDKLWETSANLETQMTRFVYSTFEQIGSKFIFITRLPRSWLTTDGTNELRGDGLVAFARLFVSGILTHRKFGMPVHWVEILDGLNTDNGIYISPENYVILVQTFKSILAQRLSPDETDIQVMGPGLPCIMSRSQTVEPYVAAFSNTSQNGEFGTIPLLDAWSIHALENETDAAYFNSGTFEARNYLRNQLQQTILFMNSIIPDIPVYVTKYASNATRYSQGFDYGPGATETIAYALRLMDNVCGIACSGVSSALCWFLYNQHDRKALYRNDGSRRPQRDALALLNTILPLQYSIFVPQDTTTGDPADQTIKMFASSRNSFGFVLSRAQSTDATAGSLSLQVPNPDWSATQYRSTMTLYVFPDSISLAGVTKTLDVTQGVMTIGLTGLPYNCVVYGKGDIYDMPAALSPIIPKGLVGIPRVSDLDALNNVNQGDVVYNVLTGILMIYVNGKWYPCQTYSGETEPTDPQWSTV